jgi:hypothetical protein
MNAASSTCPTGEALALFDRTSHALGANARGSRGTHQYDCPSVLTSTHVPALLTGKLTQRGPMSLPSIPHASRGVRPSTFDRRHREELRELLARMLT